MPTIKKAIELIFQLRNLLSSGGFHLTKFQSNQKEVVDSVPPDCRAISLKDLTFNELPMEKNSWNILGCCIGLLQDCGKGCGETCDMSWHPFHGESGI